MIEFMSIKDNETGRTLQVSRQIGSYQYPYMVVSDGLKAEEVQKRSIGKVIRTWMKEVKSDNSR